MEGDGDEYVFSSSSAESIASGSNEEEVYTEEVIEAEEGSEVVLVPGREVRASVMPCDSLSTMKVHIRTFILQNSENVLEEVDEEALGGMGYTDCFLSCVTSLKTEELIRRSPRGKRVGLLLDELGKIELEKVTEVAVLLISRASSCITSGSKHRLPSAAQASVWTTFHQRRGSPEMKRVWKAFVSSHVAESSRQESDLALQLIFDRLLKRLLHNKAVAKTQSTAHTQADSVRPLTMIESNAVRYMSGFVAVSLLKKYRKPTKHTQLKVKRALFVRVLSRMKAVDQPGEPTSVLDYTRLWSDLIDRGGLYHINDEVCTIRCLQNKNKYYRLLCLVVHLLSKLFCHCRCTF